MKIVDFKQMEKPGVLKAVFTVNIPEWDFTIVLKYFSKDTGSSWFGYPSQEYTNAKGEKKSKWLAFFGEKAKDRFETKVRELLKEHMVLEESKHPQTSNDWDEIPF